MMKAHKRFRKKWRRILGVFEEMASRRLSFADTLVPDKLPPPVRP